MIIGKFSRSLYVGSKMEYLFSAILWRIDGKLLCRNSLLIVLWGNKCVCYYESTAIQTESTMENMLCSSRTVKGSSSTLRRTNTHIRPNHLYGVEWTVINRQLTCNCIGYFKLYPSNRTKCLLKYVRMFWKNSQMWISICCSESTNALLHGYCAQTRNLTIIPLLWLYIEIHVQCSYSSMRASVQ